MQLAERIQRGRRAITLAKRRGLDTIEWENYLAGLLAGAGREPTEQEGLEPRMPHQFMLREWRRVSIPRWRDILQESIERGDASREEYARWMLREVLLDPEYEEPQ